VSKEIVVRLTIPEWVNEERVKKRIQKFTDELVESGEQTAEEARRFYNVEELSENIEVPPELERKIVSTRRKRGW
jgi:polyhydroxyalkanoate synthesis regulator phasin